GSWVDSTDSQVIDVINPATEEVFGQISNGTEEDLNKAVKAANEAFPSFSKTTSKERIDLLNRIVEEYEKRKDDLIQDRKSTRLNSSHVSISYAVFCS